MPLFAHKSLAAALTLALALTCATPSFAKSDNKPKDPIVRDKSSYSPSQVSLGVHGFYNYLYPSARYERAIASWLSFSVTGLYSNARPDGVRTLFYGGYGSMNIYLDTGGFHGLWLQGGYGAWSMEASAAGQSQRLFRRFIMASLGFRVAFLGPFRLGVSGGLFYQEPARSLIYDFNLHRTMPAISADFGFTF